MMLPLRPFNIILAVLVLAAFGCRSAAEKEKAKQGTSMRFHLETNPDGTHFTFPAMVYRSNPMRIHAVSDLALDEGFMDKAELVAADEFGNFAIKITFDENGRRQLDYLTSSYKGRRLLILSQWTEIRALAAPLITKRISDGVFIFTPDATREESERIVSGLNNVIKELKKPYTF